MSSMTIYLLSSVNSMKTAGENGKEQIFCPLNSISKIFGSMKILWRALELFKS